MQHFSADTTIFKKNAPENMKKTPSKDAHNRPKFFIVLPTGPKPAHFLFHENVSLCDFYMTLTPQYIQGASGKEGVHCTAMAKQLYVIHSIHLQRDLRCGNGGVRLISGNLLFAISCDDFILQLNLWFVLVTICQAKCQCHFPIYD